MSPELVGGSFAILGALVGAIVPAIFTNIRDKKRMQYELEKIELESKIVFNKEELNKLESRKEELFNALQNLRSGFSITQNCVMANLNISYEDYEKHHQKMDELILRAERLINLYFPILKMNISEICGLSSQMWGYQQHYFDDDIKNSPDKQKRQLVLNEITKLSINISEKCFIIMESLSKTV